jgi:hypothetical protein
MEIMLDRTHSRDDNLGMGEGITDSVRYRQQVCFRRQSMTTCSGNTVRLVSPPARGSFWECT